MTTYKAETMARNYFEAAMMYLGGGATVMDITVSGFWATSAVVVRRRLVALVSSFGCPCNCR